ncbi:MAG: amino acid adenylation domain-containing protein, partial [Acidobacteriota bacterium]|nr:amino acid adenylation domain-containing protein [Acidobacteriota bacterium]
VDRQRPAVRTSKGVHRTRVLPRNVLERLGELARSENATLFMVLLAAFYVFLQRHTGQDDISVATPIAGRTVPAIEPLIGFFANTLVLRSDFSGKPTFRELLRRVRETALDSYTHQDVPFEKLVEMLRPDRHVAQNPLAQALFVLQNSPSSALALPGAKVTPIDLVTRTARFDLEFHARETEAGLSCMLIASSDLFDEEAPDRFLDRFEALVSSILANPNLSIGELSLLPEWERNRVLVEWNQTDHDFGAPRCIHELFEAQAARTPRGIAVRGKTEEVTYEELNARANGLAHRLRGLGVGPDTLVAVCLDRSADLLVALLAVWKAGGAYVPIDPSYPAERVEYMLEDSAASVVIAAERFRELVGESRIVLSVSSVEEKPPDSHNPSTVAGPENLAYVLYTSGSTGRPKGVAIEHRNTFAFLQWAQTVFGSENLAGVLGSTSVCFDLSVFELFAPLCCGGTVVISEDALELPELPARNRVSLINTVPSAIVEIIRVKALPESVRTVNLAGEPLPSELAAQVYESGRVESVYNLYGPTESTTYSTFTRVPRAAGPMTIGRPIANTRVYLLDDQLRPCPPGSAGELYIAGDGLALGYWRRPELTEQKFIPSPFPAVEPGRLYRSGDLGRCLPDGNIEFLGRVDRQVKIRGYRIEPDEIETVIASHPRIRQSVVVAVGAGGDKHLVAYVVADGLLRTSEPRHEGRAAKGEAGEGVPAEPPAVLHGRLVPEVRRFLQSRLPEYMVPSSFVVLDSLPLDRNGKIDRRSLPAVSNEREVETPFLPPRTPVEEMLCEIWKELLGLEVVGIDDNFFELGGHSLIANQLLSRIWTGFGIEIPLPRFFRSPTVREIAERLSGAERRESLDAVSIRPVPRSGDLPLSLSQENVWFLQELDPDNRAYQFQPTLRFHGELDEVALERSLAEVLRRHEILRTTFPSVEGAPVQRIHASLSTPLTVVDLQEVAESARHGELRRRIDEEVQRTFDLTKLPLVRWTLYRLGPQERVLQHVEHHIVHDGWSFNVFLRELATLYRAFQDHEPSPLPEPEIQFGDYAVFQRRWMETGEARVRRAYWTEKLAATPAALEIPSDRPRKAVQTFRGAVRVVELPIDLAEALRALSRREGCTLFMTMLAAFATLLYRYSGREDFCIGSGVANRRWLETEGLMGMFVNMVALRMDLGGEPTFTELLGRVRDVTLEGYENQDYPFAAVVDAVQPERTLRHSPLCQVLFSFHDAPLADLDFGGPQVD